MNITDLPSENLLHIFSYLKENDLASAASACATFRSLATDKSLDFPRISYVVNQNISEGRFFLSHQAIEKLPNQNHVFHVIDSNPVLLRIKEETGLDNRTTIKVIQYVNYRNSISKEIRIGEKLASRKNSTLTLDETIIANNVIDFACMNGSIIYSDLKGLHRYHPSTDRKERITRKVYMCIAVDERKGIIYGIDSTNIRIDKLDFNHPDAKIRKEDTFIYSLKKRVSLVAVTFFKEMKNFVVQNADWKVAPLLLGIIVVISLGFGIAAGIASASLSEFLFTTALITVTCLTSFTLTAIFETLKYAVIKAYDAALKPL